MTLNKLVNGKIIELTKKEEDARIAEEIEAAKPPTQAEHDARADAVIDQMDKALRAEILDLAKLVDPTLTEAKFNLRIRNRVLVDIKGR